MAISTALVYPNADRKDFIFEREKPSSTFDAYQVLGFGHNCLTFFPINLEPVSENSPREDCLPTLELFATEAL